MNTLITGASTGIGAACADLLARQGHRVFAGVRREEDAQKLISLNSKIIPVFLDVTKTQSIDAAQDTIAAVLGPEPLHGLVNNAGIAVAGPLEFISINELRWQFEVNFFGVISVTQSFMPLLRRGQGRIVNMSSMSGKLSSPMFGPYAASKFALEAASDSLRRELLTSGIQVAVIEPGAIKTPIWDKGHDLMEKINPKYRDLARQHYAKMFDMAPTFIETAKTRGIAPEAVAQEVFHALTSSNPQTRYSVGLDAKIGIFLAQLLPDSWIDYLLNKRFS